MKKVFFLAMLMFSLHEIKAQTIKLTDYLLYPRLDSNFWEKDFDILNAASSSKINQCQTCVFNQTDSTRGRFCFNTSHGHVQLDSVLRNFSLLDLTGQWNVITFGLFEITDSIPTGSKIYYRKEKILKEQNQDNGQITFSENEIITDLKNIEDIPNKKARYKIIESKFLLTKTAKGYCGATMIGLTKDGFLILDDHTYKTIAKKGCYLSITTSIRRMILKK